MNYPNFEAGRVRAVGPALWRQHRLPAGRDRRVPGGAALLLLREIINDAAHPDAGHQT